MRLKYVFAFLLVCSLVVVAALFIRAMPHKEAMATPAAAPPVVHDEVLVAARQLPAGLLLRAQDLAWREQSVPAEPGEIRRPSVDERAAKPESDELAAAVVFGAALKVGLHEGQPIRHYKFVKPGDRDFLQTVLAQGTRALAIPVSAASGGTGLMFPGDHVDVMLTQTFKNEDAPLTRRSVSETVVEDLRVLAIDRPKTGPGALTVTVEAMPQQAEKINVAQELGRLSLTLRSLSEPVAENTGAAPAPLNPPPSPPTWAGDVSPALQSAQPPARVLQAEKPGIRVMRGNNSIDTKAQ